MATLVLTALGTAIGGPLGGAIGSLVGNQLDRALIGGSGRRDGPRLKELTVSTSSYGTPLPRHFGTVRTGGSIIWATPLSESTEKSGGKGKPSTATYSYSVSFAVALASRPILRLGRIWADGNLLRGVAGDLKTGGELRIYTGHGDQQPNPLIAADKGPTCPAFRGLAYCVFESLQLADFGNRIPTLSFEIVADGGQIMLEDLIQVGGEAIDVQRPLAQLLGFSDEGGPLADSLATIAQLYPIAFDAGGVALSITAETAPAAPPILPPAATDSQRDTFGGAAGNTRRQQADASEIADAVRYYDAVRDYQAGVQRAEGRPRPGRTRILEFPGVLQAGTARALVNAATERAKWSRETVSWRVAELDPSLGPGRVVQLPDRAGQWLIESWEWRECGIELELRRLPPGQVRASPASAGDVLPKPDLVATPTELVAFELPWDGQGAGDAPQAFAAASSSGAGWKGAALYLDQAGSLLPLGTSGRSRSIVGELAAPLAPSPAVLFESDGWFEIELASDDFALADATLEDLAQGNNRAVLGSEVLQFVSARRIAARRWSLSGLLRGRGGTEAAALAGHAVGDSFVLLDGSATALDAALFGPGEVTIAAIGVADSDPVIASLLNAGATRRPLTPVHPRMERDDEGNIRLSWVRRARGAWRWPDAVDAPLNEQTERYLVGIGDSERPAVRWEVTETELQLPAAVFGELASTYAGQPVWVRQLGTFAISNPLLLVLLS